MSRPGPPPSQPAIPPGLPVRTGDVPLRPAGSLERIEVTVRYNAWDLYRMEMAERWRRSHSADAPLFSSAFPVAVVLWLLVQLAYALLYSTAWRASVAVVAFWFLVLWAIWWTVAPFLEARRAAEAALSDSPPRFVFTPEGVEMIHLDVSMKIAWPGIRRVRETSFSFLIYPRQPSPYSTTPDGRLVQILPWMKLYFTLPIHCFADAADLRLFRAMLRTHVTPEIEQSF